MKDPDYWRRYVVDADPDVVAAQITTTRCGDDSAPFELVTFERGPDAPNVLISQGSGGHAYVFAALAHHIHARGYNVFIMPKHGGATITELQRRHEAALRCISERCNDRIGIFAEGLGGYVAFYLALDHALLRSLVCQNAPAILTEKAWHQALARGRRGAALRRKLLLPLGRYAVRVAPRLKLPITAYLDFRELVDTDEPSRSIEGPMIDAYRADPDFDRWYPLRAVMALVDTPPPAPLEELTTPTMFLLPVRGFVPAYVEGLFDRLPPMRKKLVAVDGTVFWMVSHPGEAAAVICDWFDETV